MEPNHDTMTLPEGEGLLHGVVVDNNLCACRFRCSADCRRVPHPSRETPDLQYAGGSISRYGMQHLDDSSDASSCEETADEGEGTAEEGDGPANERGIDPTRGGDAMEKKGRRVSQVDRTINVRARATRVMP